MNTNVYRKILVFVFASLAILLSTFRDLKSLPSGNDTPIYSMMYDRYLHTSWESLIDNFSFYSTDYSVRDLGYPIFIKITQFFVEDFTFFMFLTAFIFIVPLSQLIYRYVKSYLGIVLAFLIYFVLFQNIVNSFMRQAIVLGLLLFGIRYILNSKWKQYLALMTIAFTIHSSSILAVPLYFLVKCNLQKTWMLLCILISPLFIYYSSWIITYVASDTVYDGYAEDNMVLPLNYILFILIISLLTYVNFDRIKRIIGGKLLLTGVLGSLLVLPLVGMGNTLLRTSYYFTLFLIPLFPLILDNMKMKKVTCISLYVICILFFSIYLFI